MTERDHDNKSNNTSNRVAMNNRAIMKEEEIRKTGFLEKIFRI